MMKAPFFEGLPSPALGKMQRLPPARLRAYLEQLQKERELLLTKLKNVGAAVDQANDPRVALEKRLGQLIKKGEEILANKRRDFRPPPR